MRILNVADFNWITGAERRHGEPVPVRHLPQAVASRQRAPIIWSWSFPTARWPAGARSAAAREASTGGSFRWSTNFAPDLILLHFADQINNAFARGGAPALARRRDRRHQHRPDRYARRTRGGWRCARGVADALFVTTAEPALGRYAGRGAFAAFCPTRSTPPSRPDACSRPAPAFDLLFPANDDGPARSGRAFVAPSAAVRRLARRFPSLPCSRPGVGASPRARGVRYFDAPWERAHRLVPLAPGQPPALRLRPHGPHVRLGPRRAAGPPGRVRPVLRRGRGDLL